MDQWGQGYHPDPAYSGDDITPGQVSVADPPPSYEEAVGHMDVHVEAEPPPQYDDIIRSSVSNAVIGQAKWSTLQSQCSLAPEVYSTPVAASVSALYNERLRATLEMKWMQME